MDLDLAELLARGPEAGWAWARWIAASYERSVGGHLCDPEEMYACGAVVLAHDDAHDPALVYVNLAAQRLWERPWQEFVGMPSRLTAPQEERDERAAALAAPEVVRGYSGVRVSASGRRFRILDAVVWPVSDDAGRVVGQAAAFERVDEVPG